MPWEVMNMNGNSTSMGENRMYFINTTCMQFWNYVILSKIHQLTLEEFEYKYSEIVVFPIWILGFHVSRDLKQITDFPN